MTAAASQNARLMRRDDRTAKAKAGIDRPDPLPGALPFGLNATTQAGFPKACEDARPQC